jgi:hypothetical protein
MRVDQDHLKVSLSTTATASPILSMFENRGRPSATLRVRKGSRRFDGASRSFSPLRRRSLISFSISTSRAFRMRSSAAATSSSKVKMVCVYQDITFSNALMLISKLASFCKMICGAEHKTAGSRSHAARPISVPAIWAERSGLLVLDGRAREDRLLSTEPVHAGRRGFSSVLFSRQRSRSPKLFSGMDF